MTDFLAPTVGGLCSGQCQFDTESNYHQASALQFQCMRHLPCSCCSMGWLDRVCCSSLSSGSSSLYPTSQACVLLKPVTLQAMRSFLVYQMCCFLLICIHAAVVNYVPAQVHTHQRQFAIMSFKLSVDTLEHFLLLVMFEIVGLLHDPTCYQSFLQASIVKLPNCHSQVL